MSSTPDAAPDPQVPARARSRTYPAAYKARILAEYDSLDKGGQGCPAAARGPVHVADLGVAVPTRSGGTCRARRAAGSAHGGSAGSGEHQATAGERAFAGRVGQGPQGDRGAGKALRAVG